MEIEENNYVDDCLSTATIGSLPIMHYGVKGMKWGVHKSRAPKNNISYEIKTLKISDLNTVKDSGKKITESFTKQSTGGEKNSNSKNSNSKKSNSNNSNSNNSNSNNSNSNNSNSNNSNSNNSNSNNSNNKKKEEDPTIKISKSLIDSGRALVSSGDMVAKAGSARGSIRKYADSSKLSNAELIEKTNRIRLEKAYSDEAGLTKYKMSGSEKVQTLLQSAGALLTVTGGAVALIAAIKALGK